MGTINAFGFLLALSITSAYIIGDNAPSLLGTSGTIRSELYWILTLPVFRLTVAVIFLPGMADR
ncbi:hypothetical protein MTO98_25370 [Mucilaginibacter sp. SMC90]|uniref:hypothetical protein n=1 Tax=Mucilaginibacter sp. SMC90 TaxID=2929803 RepID=UPI001FB347AA|nr:hypothetical protein [Mucilaginibacter sp. SMC90]UOE47745.1 hypothetical protein MTO98_25370 [Mucilaginibacter sp. SMC90]